MNNIRTTTLPNGMRIITDTVTTVDTVALGIWAAVGTRHENLAENGVAHMVEHMLFKGTPTRNSQKIAEVIEDVGGHMNAYTDREMTAYYVHLMREDMDLALEVLADILQNSTMPEEEVERERGVILQEIKMYADSPDRQIFDNFQQAAYPDQALGFSGLGTAEIISNMQRDTLLRYVRNHYNPARLVISAAGPVDHDAFVRKIEQLFTRLPKGTKDDFKAADYKPSLSLQEKQTEQSHIILGFRGVNRLNARYPVARILSSVLGGGMSSRLFQEIREKRGLVYSIYSFQETFTDDGLFGVYAGTGPEHLAELMPAVLDELKSVSDKVDESELKRAKAQIKAGVQMARESISTRTEQQARHMIYFNEPFQVEKLISRIEAVTAKDVAQLAGEIFSTKPTLAALGPIGNLMTYTAIEQKLAA